MKKLIYAAAFLLASCSVSKKTTLTDVFFDQSATKNEAGVLFYTQHARVMKGQAKHFQLRYEAKVRRENNRRASLMVVR